MDTTYEDLYKWIEEHAITRPKRNINRDFADALPLVEILKQHFPKLVDIHNYSPKNAHAQKIINWETLNCKVLKKLNLHLTKKRIEQLAKGEVGVIEKLLLDVKKKVDAKQAGDDGDVYYVEAAPNKDLRTPKKVIPAHVLQTMQANLDEKTEAVEILRGKLDQLERILDNKEEKIKDLTQQLETIANTSRPEVPQGTKFFGLFQSSSAIPLPPSPQITQNELEKTQL